MKTIKNAPPECTSNLLAMRDTLEILGGKWKLLILHYLMTREGMSNTFKEMQRNIEGISSKMLSKELKDLEINKLINRREMNTKPKTVEYNITSHGKTTKNIISNLVEWGLKHRIELI
jgi:DNA-binding HxlR family transcriptional regulator